MPGRTRAPAPRRRAAAILGIVLLASGCGMLHLVRTMLGTSAPNERMVGQLFAVGGGGHAGLGADGVARITVAHRPRETVLRPAVITMDHPGDLELTVANDDPQAHLLIAVQSDGGMQTLDLPARRAGRVRVHLGTPGMYLFADALGNMMGRGMMGVVLVGGEVPPDAKLDRPAQRRR